MAIIFSEEDLNDVKPPCVIQSFINHNAVLYKVFVVGDSYTVVERPSLKNFPSGPTGEAFAKGPNDNAQIFRFKDPVKRLFDLFALLRPSVPSAHSCAVVLRVLLHSSLAARP